MEQQAYYLKKAAEAGIEFNDDMQADVDEQIETLKGYADSNKYSLSRYIALQYGKGLNEKIVRKILEEQAVVTAYLEDRDEKLGETITDEEIEAVFNEDPSKYQVVNLRIFAFPLEASYTADSQSEPVVPDYTDDEQRHVQTNLYQGLRTKSHLLNLPVNMLRQTNRKFLKMKMQPKLPIPTKKWLRTMSMKRLQIGLSPLRQTNTRHLKQTRIYMSSM